MMLAETHVDILDSVERDGRGCRGGDTSGTEVLVRHMQTAHMSNAMSLRGQCMKHSQINAETYRDYKTN